jgi:hypothetical protein
MGDRPVAGPVLAQDEKVNIIHDHDPSARAGRRGHWDRRLKLLAFTLEAGPKQLSLLQRDNGTSLSRRGLLGCDTV